MSSYFPHLLADVTQLPWVAIIAVGGGIALAIVVIVGGLIIAYHRQKEWHETARLALEKGQPIPSAHGESPVSDETIRETLREERDQRRGVSRDLRAGLICVAVGAGLFVFFDALLGRWMAYVGAIPGFIGVALILFGLLSLLFDRRDQSSNSRPPQS